MVINSDRGEFTAVMDVAVCERATDVTPRGLPLKTNADASAMSSMLRVAQSGVISDVRST